MQWHQDPWNEIGRLTCASAVARCRSRNPGSMAANNHTWFSKFVVPSQFQTMLQRPQVGPSLMPSSEMQAMTTMLSSLPQFQGDEEYSASDRPIGVVRLLKHVCMIPSCGRRCDIHHLLCSCLHRYTRMRCLCHKQVQGDSVKSRARHQQIMR